MASPTDLRSPPPPAYTSFYKGSTFFIVQEFAAPSTADHHVPSQMETAGAKVSLHANADTSEGTGKS